MTWTRNTSIPRKRMHDTRYQTQQKRQQLRIRTNSTGSQKEYSLHWIMLARVKLICPEVEQVSEVANGPLVDIVATRRRFFIIRVCAYKKLILAITDICVWCNSAWQRNRLECLNTRPLPHYTANKNMKWSITSLPSKPEKRCLLT